MNIKQIRNATLIIQYAGVRFSTDPVFAPKGSYPSFPNSIRPDVGNPVCDLPVPVLELLDVDGVILTHLHLDHFDDAAKEQLPKSIQLFVQNEADAQVVKDAGFTNVEILTTDTCFKNVHLSKTPGQHGRGDVVALMGNVCGVVFRHPQEKTLYVAGDTVWYDAVANTVNTYHPDIIITNNGANSLIGFETLVMDKDDIEKLHQAAPNATIIASHMEAMNHWTLSRKELRAFTEEKGFSSNVLIPEDGESYSF